LIGCQLSPTPLLWTPNEDYLKGANFLQNMSYFPGSVDKPDFSDAQMHSWLRLHVLGIRGNESMLLAWTLHFIWQLHWQNWNIWLKTVKFGIWGIDIWDIWSMERPFIRIIHDTAKLCKQYHGYICKQFHGYDAGHQVAIAFLFSPSDSSPVAVVCFFLSRAAIVIGSGCEMDDFIGRMQCCVQSAHSMYYMLGDCCQHNRNHTAVIFLLWHIEWAEYADVQSGSGVPFHIVDCVNSFCTCSWLDSVPAPGLHYLEDKNIIITRIRDILDGILEAIVQQKAALPSKILLESCNLAGKPLT
jgi:hypothetical protein